MSACSCGEVHELSAEAREFWASFIDGQPPEISVGTPAGSWMVPRIYIAAHGLKAAELPALAGQYGWERSGAA